MTRITQRLLTQSTLANLTESRGRTAKLQEQLSTGRMLNRPSDSPTSMVTAMQTRSSLARKDTHLRNLDNARGWIDTADAALQGTSAMIRQARDLTVQGANAATGQVSREAIAKQIEAIKAGLIEVANTQYAGRSLFAGNADSAAFDASGTYIGDTGAVNRTVADGQQVQINVVGSAAFGSGPGSIFDTLDQVAASLRDPDGAAGTHLTALDESLNRVLGALGGLGAVSNRIDGVQDRAVIQKTNLQTRLSEVESTDLTTTIMELRMQEVTYEAALAATGRVLQPTLLDFLR